MAFLFVDAAVVVFGLVGGVACLTFAPTEVVSLSLCWGVGCVVVVGLGGGLVFGTGPGKGELGFVLSSGTAKSGLVGVVLELSLRLFS